MSKNKPKVYGVKEEREDRETIRALKNTVRDLISENKKLRSEISTLEAAFEKTRKFMSDENAELTLEQLIEAANKHHTSKQAKKENKIHGKSKERKNQEPDQGVDDREATREKWKQWREKNFGKYDESKD